MRHCGLEVYLYHESVAYFFKDIDSYQVSIISFFRVDALISILTKILSKQPIF